MSEIGVGLVGYKFRRDKDRHRIAGPTFEDGYRCQAVIDAVERSVESRKWTTPEIERTKGGVHGEV